MLSIRSGRGTLTRGGLDKRAVSFLMCTRPTATPSSMSSTLEASRFIRLSRCSSSISFAVCVCVRVRERGRNRKRDRERGREGERDRGREGEREGG